MRIFLCNVFVRSSRKLCHNSSLSSFQYDWNGIKFPTLTRKWCSCNAVDCSHIDKLIFVWCWIIFHAVLWIHPRSLCRTASCRTFLHKLYVNYDSWILSSKIIFKFLSVWDKASSDSMTKYLWNDVWIHSSDGMWSDWIEAWREILPCVFNVILLRSFSQRDCSVPVHV